jgi:hypothetical protein
MGRPLKQLIAICTIGFVVGMVIHAIQQSPSMASKRGNGRSAGRHRSS